MSVKKESIAIGIDLGTTNSCFAVCKPEDVEIIPNAEGGRTTPSIVAFSGKDNRTPLVGVIAARQGETNPENTIAAAKRLIGRSYKEVEKELKSHPTSYKVVPNNKGEAVIQTTDGKTHHPTEIAAAILSKIKRNAEAYLGREVTSAVVTVPAYFDDRQRTATKQAGEIAGLKIDRIINEPTAAAIAYGFDKKNESKTIVVYDLGGGTFDVTLLTIEDGIFSVKASSGDGRLGGEDFDQAIVNYCSKKFFEKYNLDLTTGKDASQVQFRLKKAAEEAKKELSSSQETTIRLPFLMIGPDGKHLHLEETLTRAQFENMTKDLIERTMGPCIEVMKEAGITKDQIDEVLGVGGMIRMPAVKARVEKEFGKVVCATLNPDEAVAYGAAIQAGVLSGVEYTKGILLVDVTSLDLGIETVGSVMTVMIKRNSALPAKKVEVFSTAADNQTSVEIRVFQGNSPLAHNNKLLGSFTLGGIPPAPRGVPQIEVTFSVDTNGIMDISGMDKATSKKQNIVISSSGLSKEEIEAMVKKAEETAEEDKAKLDLITARNGAHNIIFSAEDAIKTNGDKLPDALKAEISEKVASLKAIVDEGTLEQIKEKQEELMSVLTKMYEEVSKQATANNSGQGQESNSESNEGQSNNSGDQQQNDNS